ncbi:outer membrane beta-barrel protein [Pseudoalteromonas sp. MMG013]|uniref:outer membrane beta-barrel protein n=1 Tax=Pseudoalteromonas sp. MMG013 TaxID=2822687 RepID=UPI001B39154A|nr:outer membrane beta-barrel protein [Pseudoalteromonas sp. MMG013]MBQ4862841.1 outer membrane beta-barrel protein [Pseudoalteromonas sp. MMG013]
MKKSILGGALLALPVYAKAEMTIVSEVLIGKAKNELYAYQDFDLGGNRSSSSDSDSFGLRLGLELTDNIIVEIAKHEHGESTNDYTVSIPSSLGDGFYRSFNVRLPIDIESVRFGLKGKTELFESLIVNARVGIAHWKYKGEIPARLVPTDLTNGGGSGNDIYISFGFEYKLTKNLYIGLEYSLLSINETKEYDYTGIVKYQHDVKDLSVIVGWEF